MNEYTTQATRGILTTPGKGHTTILTSFRRNRSEEHTSELQSRLHLVCRLLLEKKKHRHTAVTCRLSVFSGPPNPPNLLTGGPSPPRPATPMRAPFGCPLTLVLVAPSPTAPRPR